MEKSSKIYIAGHRGMVGSAIVRRLEENGYTNIIYRTSAELDLRNQAAVEEFFKNEKPEYVFLAAAKVGGIHANNTYPAEFIYDNLMIETNIINSAYKNGVKKLLFLGSSCIYPKFAEQPIKEEYLLTGSLEETNEAYAIAKITGIELCKFYRRQYGCDFISAMPTNLYGVNDNFNLETSHVMPALIRKFHEAKINNSKEVVMWGTGKPRREFMYVDDLADSLIHLMLNYSDEIHVNLGTGEDIEIGELANLIKKIVGYEGKIVNDLSKPDGTPRKLLDVTRLNSTGFKHKVELEEGIQRVYEWFLNTQDVKK
ncbi:GDP-L-fucose synthase [Candidatus Cetobacterium colombiensis]|uniref:GDP-L-fucose synthase n=1 Tax=Candidatus Cetobacterium colombiensis TaxID=3073100 RepID=A0ABU4W8V1_9FUSO|nr:GDP-L-fucose synthase [Candidatus Cetobacterium colombiensis]MDX8335942.1 GDP-L-fucose synthase [Candidatus Cetobacterium colombiensis]